MAEGFELEGEGDERFSRAGRGVEDDAVAGEEFEDGFIPCWRWSKFPECHRVSGSKPWNSCGNPFQRKESTTHRPIGTARFEARAQRKLLTSLDAENIADLRTLHPKVKSWIRYRITKKKSFPDPASPEAKENEQILRDFQRLAKLIEDLGIL